MEVNYTSSRADMWRCNLYILAHKPLEIVFRLLPPVVLTGLIYSAFYHPPVQPLTWQEATMIFLVVFGGFAVFNALFMASAIDSVIQARSSNPDTPGVTTTSLTPEGIRDLTPEQDQLLVWKDVRGIRLHNGDLYVRKASGTIYVPRSAFKDRTEAQQFYQSALDLWRDHPASEAVSSIQRFGRAGRNALSATDLSQTVSAGMKAKMATGQLEEGETVLWKGQPNPFFYAGGKPLFGTSVLISIALLLLSFDVISSGFTDWILPLIILGLGLGWTMYCHLPDRAGAQKLEYTVTDKSILASERKGILAPQFDVVDLSQIESVKYWKKSSTTGSLEFGTAKNSVLFDSIDDFATVASLVAARRGQQSGDLNALFMSRSKSDPFSGILLPDESVLWQGQPDRRVYVKEFWGSWGGIVFYPILAWLILVTSLTFTQTQPLWKQTAELTPFVFLGVGFIVRRYRARLKNASTLFYAVTNCRLLLFDQLKPQFFAEADLAQISKMRYEGFSSGIGTLSYGGKYANELDFEFLTNPSEVRQIINEAKQKISGIEMDWVDVATERAKKPKPLFRSPWMIALTVFVMLYFPVQLAVLSYYKHHYFYPGMRHYNRGEYAAAAHDFRIATNATMSERAPYYLGLALMHEGKNQEAIQAFDQAYDRALAGRYPDYEMEKQAQSMIDQINAVQARAASVKIRR